MLAIRSCNDGNYMDIGASINTTIWSSEINKEKAWKYQAFFVYCEINNKRMENKQTAVDFAIEQLERLIPAGNQAAIFVINEKAKQIQKEQIEDAYITSTAQFSVDARIDYPKSAEQYYNETYEATDNREPI